MTDQDKNETKDSDEQSPQKEPEQESSLMGAGIAIGVGVGIALGTAMGNIAAGLSIGIAIGIAIAVSRRKNNRDDEQYYSDVFPEKRNPSQFSQNGSRIACMAETAIQESFKQLRHCKRSAAISLSTRIVIAWNEQLSERDCRVVPPRNNAAAERLESDD